MFVLPYGLCLGTLVVILQCVETIPQTGWTAEKIANSMNIKYKVESNFISFPNAPTPLGVATLNITNTGIETLPQYGYSIVFCHRNRLFPLQYNPVEKEYITSSKTRLFIDGGYLLKYKQGCMYELIAMDSDKLSAKATISLLLQFMPSMGTKSDTFPNVFIKYRSGVAIVSNTKNVNSYVIPFDTPSMIRNPMDIPSIQLQPQDKYVDISKMAPRNVKQDTIKSTITPPVVLQTLKTGYAKIDRSWVIHAQPLFTESAKVLHAMTGLKIHGATKNVILLKSGPKPGKVNSNEWYKLTVSITKIELVANSTDGMSRAVQSLLGLVIPYAGDNNILIRAMEVQDYPRFEHRALMVDIASNFLGFETYTKLLRLMAHNKLNKLVLKIWNNYGFRVQIEAIPELTRVGGVRCALEKKDCIPVQLGSNPLGTGLGNGFFKKNEYIKFLKEAKKLGIQVIPAINMGRNAGAAIRAMESYAERTKDRNMILIDKSESTMTDDLDFDHSSVNPCRPEAITFLRAIVKALRAYHNRGGDTDMTICLDSSLDITQMRSSSACFPAELQTKFNLLSPAIREINITDRINLLKANYNNKLHAVFQEYNVKFCASDDLLTVTPGPGLSPLMPHNISRYDNKAIVNVKRFAFPLNARVQELADAGYKVIVSPSHLLTFNYADEVNPEKNGDLINDIEDIRRRVLTPDDIHNFAPKAHCCNIHTGESLKCSVLVCHRLSNPNNIIGIQGSVNTETIRSPEDFFSRLAQKLFFFGVRAWHEAPWEKKFERGNLGQLIRELKNNNTQVFTDRFEDFQKTMDLLAHKDLLYLHNRNFSIDIPPPAGVYDNSTGDLNTTHIFAGYKIQMKNGKKWVKVGAFGNKKFHPSVEIRAAHPRGKPVSKPVVLVSGVTPLDTDRGKIIVNARRRADENRKVRERFQKEREAFENQSKQNMRAQQGNQQSPQSNMQGSNNNMNNNNMNGMQRPQLQGGMMPPQRNQGVRGRAFAVGQRSQNMQRSHNMQRSQNMQTRGTVQQG